MLWPMVASHKDFDLKTKKGRRKGKKIRRQKDGVGDVGMGGANISWLITLLYLLLHFLNSIYILVLIKCYYREITKSIICYYKHYKQLFELAYLFLV